MSGWEPGFTSFWWVCPFFMFIMMPVACFMMRRCFRTPGHGKAHRLSTGTAEEILKKRFALGEIDKNNYEEMKAAITVEHRRPEQ